MPNPNGNDWQYLKFTAEGTEWAKLFETKDSGYFKFVLPKMSIIYIMCVIYYLSHLQH